MKRVALLAGVMLALGASEARARATIIAPPGSTVPYQRWVDQAKVPTPPVRLTIIEEPCVDEADFSWGCTQMGTFTINVAGPWKRETLMHELGHNFDYYALPEWARARYMRLLGRTGAWREGGDPAHELFADNYALCAFRPRLPRGGLVRSQQPVGGWRVYNRACRMIQNVG